MSDLGLAGQFREQEENAQSEEAGIGILGGKIEMLLAWVGMGSGKSRPKWTCEGMQRRTRKDYQIQQWEKESL